MTRLVVACDDVIRITHAWLNTMEVQPGDKIEIRFGEGEMIIRPLVARDSEMLARVRANMKKYESALRRLADS
ncbi:MAG: AbrB family transcriptional regulator [Chloroflexi bacterium]|nr:AbrB family transcriptional regulator [Chloroflexota bacterium]